MSKAQKWIIHTTLEDRSNSIIKINALKIKDRPNVTLSLNNSPQAPRKNGKMMNAYI
jgi:hypothetical protein